MLGSGFRYNKLDEQHEKIEREREGEIERNKERGKDDLNLTEESESRPLLYMIEEILVNEEHSFLLFSLSHFLTLYYFIFYF